MKIIENEQPMIDTNVPPLGAQHSGHHCGQEKMYHDKWPVTVISKKRTQKIMQCKEIQIKIGKRRPHNTHNCWHSGALL